VTLTSLEPQWSLGGRVILVTGGSRGIGEATAWTVARAGATVALCSRHVEDCRAVATSIRRQGGQALPFECDLTDAAAVDALADRVAGEAGRLDGLVNNAGTIVRKAAAETTVAEWEEMLGVHVVAAARLTGAAVPHLARHGGAVVNVASTHALLGVTGRAAYATAKAGLVHLTRVLAVELAPHGIRVNCVAPGLVDTPLSRPLLDDPATRARLTAAIPLGRPASSDDVAAAVVFFLSPASAYVTGQVLAVDGGRSVAG
jgi:2-deoxy-D-gluconate 3-dehydrogenase